MLFIFFFNLFPPCWQFFSFLTYSQPFQPVIVKPNQTKRAMGCRRMWGHLYRGWINGAGWSLKMSTMVRTWAISSPFPKVSNKPNQTSPSVPWDADEWGALSGGINGEWSRMIPTNSLNGEDMRGATHGPFARHWYSPAFSLYHQRYGGLQGGHKRIFVPKYEPIFVSVKHINRI